MLRKVVKQPVYQHHHPQHHHHHYQYHNEIAYWEPGIADFGLATSALTSTEFGCGSLR